MNRRNTNGNFMRNKKNSIDRNAPNAKKRAGYASNANGSGTMTSLSRVNSYKILTAYIGRDADGNIVGPSLDEFRIQRIVGTGAYAVVKLAVHEQTKKRVALKIYNMKQLDKLKRQSIW